MRVYDKNTMREYDQPTWNIKYYGWENDWEIESAVRWAFGDYMYNDGGHFEEIDNLLGRKVRASIEGRSGGRLEIHEELTEEEYNKLDEYVKACMKALPEFLKEEREMRAQEEKDAEEAEEKLRNDLNNDPRVHAIKQMLDIVAGNDCTLLIKGIRIK